MFPKSPHSIFRGHCNFGLPCEQVEVIAHDDVKISGTILSRGKRKNNCVVMLNSAIRSRHQFGMVLLAEWLADTFDVVSFDMRGHFDSGGSWNPVDAVLDVGDIVKSLRRHGYGKIGVFGKSIGGWAGIIDGAMYKSSDSIAALSAPLNQLQLNNRLQRYVNFHFSRFGIITRPMIETILKVRIRSLVSEYSVSTHLVHVSPTPLLLMHYQIDTMLGTTSEEARVLFEKALAPKRFVELKGKGHGLELEVFKKIATELNNWFDQTLNS